MKTIGLAAVAAMALMAFVVGTATATTLKSGTTTVTSFETSLTGSAELKNTEGTVLDTGTVAGISFSAAQDTAEGELKGSSPIAWGPKDAGFTQTTDTLNSGSLGITWIKGTINGTVKSYNAEVTAELIGVSCVYGTATTGTIIGTLVGSRTSKATIEINAPLEKKAGGFLCPSSVVWRANYIVTRPKPLTVVN